MHSSDSVVPLEPNVAPVCRDHLFGARRWTLIAILERTPQWPAARMLLTPHIELDTPAGFDGPRFDEVMRIADKITCN